MKTLYIDCAMGAAGDMLTAALLELLPEGNDFLERLGGAGIPNVTVHREASVKCGITGTHISVKIDGIEEGEEDHDHDHHHDHDDHDHEHHHHDHDDHDHDHHHDHDDHDHDHDAHHHHHHTHLADIERIVGSLKVSEKVKKDVLAVYGLIAEAESKAHGMPITDIHFHEVGTMDAVADVTAVCMLMEELHPEQVIVSPIHVGSGQVRCAHGVLPVPAPATAHILQGCPTYGGQIRGELCTPTGAALLKYFATSFGPMPVMRTERIGYGMGKKDFEMANCVRVMLGESEEQTSDAFELECNVDDMTPEEIGFAMERLYEAGAAEVYTVAVGMKKNRPGVLLKVICEADPKEQLVKTLFKYTTTIGVREHAFRRYKLRREIREIETPYGIVHEKVSEGYGVTRRKLEYDDLSRIATERSLTLAEVRDAARKTQS